MTETADAQDAFRRRAQFAPADEGPESAQGSLVDFSFRIPAIAVLLVLGLVLRLLLATLPGFAVDIGTFQAWSTQLANDGPWNFYESDFFTDYAPGYMYVLWLIGALNEIFHFNQSQWEYILKLPSIAADLASAYLLYRLVDSQRMEVRLLAAALYLLFPAAWLIGAIWGQVDSLLAFFLLLSVYFIGRGRPMAGAIAFTVGFLVKPQAIAALPFLAIWIMRRNPPRVWLEIFGVALLVALVFITPFFTYKPWDIVGQLYEATDVENYRVNSFWAYNFWNIEGLFDSGFKPDSQQFLGLDHRYWGLLMFGAAVAAIIAGLWRSDGTWALALGTALSILVFYMFLTRMHERYVFAFFLPCLAACVLVNSRALWTLFIGISLIHFLNLYHVFVYYYPQDLKVGWFYKWFEKSDLVFGLETVQVLSILFFVGALMLIVVGSRLTGRTTGAEAA